MEGVFSSLKNARKKRPSANRAPGQDVPGTQNQPVFGQDTSYQYQKSGHRDPSMGQRGFSDNRTYGRHNPNQPVVGQDTFHQYQESGHQDPAREQRRFNDSRTNDWQAPSFDSQSNNTGSAQSYRTGYIPPGSRAYQQDQELFLFGPSGPAYRQAPPPSINTSLTALDQTSVYPLEIETNDLTGNEAVEPPAVSPIKHDCGCVGDAFRQCEDPNVPLESLDQISHKAQVERLAGCVALGAAINRVYTAAALAVEEAQEESSKVRPETVNDRIIWDIKPVDILH
ncbi:hypothetical protein F5Y19DRAFT_478826 [Xylariaceae sp. FL1651]|nr:hypothetical protein F5Y19DRAFT_478826 [Xylariaceae sp. FL1651]